MSKPTLAAKTTTRRGWGTQPWSRFIRLPGLKIETWATQAVASSPAPKSPTRPRSSAWPAPTQRRLVDMEAAAVARLAAMRAIPFYCVKGVSDGFGEQLPDFNRFISDNGKFQLLRFVVFVLLRPWHWPALIRMGENSRKAAQGIAESLLDILDENGSIRKRNAYPNR